MINLTNSKPSNKTKINKTKIKVTKHLFSWSNRTNNLSRWDRRDWNYKVCIRYLKGNYYPKNITISHNLNCNNWSDTIKWISKLIILKPTPTILLTPYLLVITTITIRYNNSSSSKRTSLLSQKAIITMNKNINNIKKKKRMSLLYLTDHPCLVINNTTPPMFSSNKGMNLTPHLICSTIVRTIMIMNYLVIFRHKFSWMHKVGSLDFHNNKIQQEYKSSRITIKYSLPNLYL